MPIYEYECGKCGHEFEREQRMSDPPVKTCPECRSRKVTKLISRSSFVLRGGGWYADGYADSKKSTGTGATETSGTASTPTEGAAASSTSSEKSTTDSKPKDTKKKDKPSSKSAA